MATVSRNFVSSRKGLSEREYARHAGVSRGCVQKARSSGRLVLYFDGSIDAASSDALRLQATDPSKQRGRHATFAKPVPQEALGAVADTLREQGMPASTAGGLTFSQARIANEVMKAQLRRIELAKKKSELVDRARATALVFRLARQERDAWIGWPSRVAALIAAELGINAHAMQTVLEKHVREHLLSLSEIRPVFVDFKRQVTWAWIWIENSAAATA